MSEYPTQLASNGPNLDQLAMGWPDAGFAEISATPTRRSVGGLTVDEMVGRAPTPAQATATFRRAKDVIFGSCDTHWPGQEAQDPYAMSWAGPGLFAFEEKSEWDYGISSAAVVILGHRGHFDFELRVGNFSYSSMPPPPTDDAAVPTRAQLAAVLTPALHRLGT
jgi:hypothetical protein